MTQISSADHSYRAVCFDLDGTLLPMDLHEFLSSYYKALAAFAVAHGCNAGEVSKALDAGIAKMLNHEEGRTNHDVFWEVFCRNMDQPDRDWEALFTQFYEDEFGTLGANVVPNPAAARAIETLRAKGYPLVLTTMPLFPRRAVEWRLQWAGVDPSAFERLTTYDNSTSTKPHGAYYQENLDVLGLSGEEVLMVGNNTVEDLAFTKLGADAFLVTDCLLNPNDMDVNEVRHGTLEEFAAWVETLPNCENPA